MPGAAASRLSRCRAEAAGPGLVRVALPAFHPTASPQYSGPGDHGAAGNGEARSLLVVLSGLADAQGVLRRRGAGPDSAMAQALPLPSRTRPPTIVQLVAEEPGWCAFGPRRHQSDVDTGLSRGERTLMGSPIESQPRGQGRACYRDACPALTPCPGVGAGSQALALFELQVPVHGGPTDADRATPVLSR